MRKYTPPVSTWLKPFPTHYGLRKGQKRLNDALIWISNAKKVCFRDRASLKINYSYNKIHCHVCIYIVWYVNFFFLEKLYQVNFINKTQVSRLNLSNIFTACVWFYWFIFWCQNQIKTRITYEHIFLHCLVFSINKDFFVHVNL